MVLGLGNWMIFMFIWIIVIRGLVGGLLKCWLLKDKVVGGCICDGLFWVRIFWLLCFMKKLLSLIIVRVM